ncbi:MAG: Heme-binding protein [Pedosphaera sp.]|nr:Heme-binding protein [Pedosphaera sp.]
MNNALTMKARIRLPIGLLFGLLLGLCRASAQPTTAEPDRNAIAIEALSRLKGMDMEANPSLKAAVLKVLESTRGTPNFVKIVNDFQLKGQNAGLLEVALQHPADETGVEAARLILASHDLALLHDALHGTNSTAGAKIIEALGNTHDKEILPLLVPLVTDETRDVSIRRQAIRSLAQVQEGAATLLQFVEQDKVPNSLKFTANTELNAVRWPELKVKAARLLPPPQARNTEPLPPLAELAQKKGDPARGAQVFARAEVGCINCHRINEKGADLGPALSEIGTKLGKDALYEAILDPSAGIAFGYEAWQLELKSGDEAYGIIISETAEELTLKDPKAIPTRIKRSEIATRRQLKTSIMPTDLQQTMSTQDLIDLVEYLYSLKKPPANP